MYPFTLTVRVEATLAIQHMRLFFEAKWRDI